MLTTVTGTQRALLPVTYDLQPSRYNPWPLQLQLIWLWCRQHAMIKSLNQSVGYRVVLAIEITKATMNLTEWTGDPCLPTSHPWVKCSQGNQELAAPEIIEV